LWAPQVWGGMWALEWAFQTLFFCQLIGTDETNAFQLKLASSMKILGATGLSGLWALEWAWHIRVTNLRSVQGYGI